MVLDLLDVESPFRAGYEPVMRGAGAKGKAGERFQNWGGIDAIAKVGRLLTGESCLRLHDSSEHRQELRGGIASG